MLPRLIQTWSLKLPPQLGASNLPVYLSSFLVRYYCQESLTPVPKSLHCAHAQKGTFSSQHDSLLGMSARDLCAT